MKLSQFRTPTVGIFCEKKSFRISSRKRDLSEKSLSDLFARKMRFGKTFFSEKISDVFSEKNSESTSFCYSIFMSKLFPIIMFCLLANHCDANENKTLKLLIENRSCNGCNLSKLNLGWYNLLKVDLSGADLSESYLVNVDLSNANLSY